MIWTGLEALGEVPFTDVIIHSTVLALDGRRMSKSLGTGIDPMEPIEEYGADATRYGLLKISSTQDVRFSYGAIEEGRKLAIKLWNVARLMLQNADGVVPALRPRDLEERWILARLEQRRARGGVVALRLRRGDGDALPPHLRRLRDWYAEAIKPRLYDRDEADSTAPRARAPARAPASGDAARHRGDLVALPIREARLIVSPWPGRTTLCRRPRALTACRRRPRSSAERLRSTSAPTASFQIFAAVDATRAEVDDNRRPRSGGAQGGCTC
jgi:hypothetical protein